MPDIPLTALVLLCLAALLAGWIDAVVGGGGLLLLPALLLGVPQVPAVQCLGTNKAVGIVGTTGAAVTYARAAPVPVATAVRIGLAALAGSMGGALLAAGVDNRVLRPVILAVLLGVAAFVLLRPSFGAGAAPGPVRRARVVAAVVLVGGGLGFYDGLFGPGTGTFLVLALTAALRLDLVTASATAKVVNVCTNGGALAVFAYQGSVLWRLAALMAVFNLAGGTLGARTALRRGTGFVRGVLLVVVFSLVAKLALDQWA
ncbi:sulfite exporter TauE/SafE family protein [Streptomyces somaliensis DSM 40738]|uniref:Probable membrane transporter protein n=1 Tax=Streptomyces somaliensis (strain ATCC 33201 / DSM 40738 / JCM 12659 / KCTC 9044 / NCTC 11332 / NRRL B-12077 / IP 733) TaxID=1134445 RepID=A0AA44D9M8_STRE0|nr:sulfite exporter TauE/SafE family protein [Streptomyces somaliensis]MCQ0022638.1 sulfite exporter TauE/SafE family protein [Streptomyces somaliensis DSM 40738]NKY12767.1 sulfite exporter TauE/SafE family protein [Streptomyces somaliensis DSM 40738]